LICAIFTMRNCPEWMHGYYSIAARAPRKSNCHGLARTGMLRHSFNRNPALMKITDIITHQLSVKVDEPFTSSRGWIYTTKNALVVEIKTDSGLTGWGDCYGPSAVARSIVDTLRAVA